MASSDLFQSETHLLVFSKLNMEPFDIDPFVVALLEELFKFSKLLL